MRNYLLASPVSNHLMSNLLMCKVYEFLNRNPRFSNLILLLDKFLVMLDEKSAVADPNPDLNKGIDSASHQVLVKRCYSVEQLISSING